MKQNKLSAIIPATVEHAVGRGNYTIITLLDGKQILAAYSLYLVADWLNLTRVHKQTAINLRLVDEITPCDQVIMRSGKAFDIARRRRGDIDVAMTLLQKQGK